MAKTVVTGATGLLGSFLHRSLARRRLTWGLGRSWPSGRSDGERLDLLAPGLWHRLDRLQPDVIVHAAGLADPEACESDPELAWRLNVDMVADISSYCAVNAIQLVLFSTDLVFDGSSSSYREDAVPTPLQVYGRTKALAETHALNVEGASVLRLGLIYGGLPSARPCFVRHCFDALNSNMLIQADGGQQRHPISCIDVAVAVNAIIDSALSGIFHISGPTAITKTEWAKQIAEIVGKPTRHIVTIDSVGHSRRPQCVNLDITCTERKLGLAFRSVERGTRTFIANTMETAA